MKAGGRKLLTGFLIILLGIVVPSEADAAGPRLRSRVSVYSGGQQQPLHLPEGVGGVSASELIVADTGNGRLLRYKAENEFDYQLEAAVKLPAVIYPTKLQVRHDGDIFVLDRHSLTILHLSRDGTHEGPVRFEGDSRRAVKSFALDSAGNMYVLELDGRRVSVFDRHGVLRRQLPISVDSAIVSDLAVAPQARILAVDPVEGIVYTAGPSENVMVPITAPLKQYARFPSRITTDDRGRIYLSDRNGCRIVILGQDGSFLVSRSARGFKEGLLQFPGQISIAGDTLLVADTRNHRIQVFTISE